MYPNTSGCRRSKCPFLGETDYSTKCKIVDRMPGSLQACPIDEIRYQRVKWPDHTFVTVECGTMIYDIAIDTKPIYEYIKERFS